jgi:SAM-dependent methyltransferase
MPLPEDIGKAYRSYYTHETVAPGTGWRRLVFGWPREGYLAWRYGYPPGSWGVLKRGLGVLVALLPDRREYLDLRVMRLRARPGRRLLDVGCGSGRFIRLMQELGWRAEGVDFDKAAVETARRDGLSVRLGALEAQGYAGGSFDAVTINHVIEHVPDPVGLLRESHRILAPSGQIIVVTPNAASLGHARFRDAWRGLEPPRHLQIFSPQSMRAALERAGFTGCSIRTSVQLAGMIYGHSVALRAGVSPRSAKAPGRGGYWFMLEEAARRAADPECGEEVVATAVKG